MDLIDEFTRRLGDGAGTSGGGGDAARPSAMRPDRPARWRRSLARQMEEIGNRFDMLSDRIHAETRNLKRVYVERWVMVGEGRRQALPRAITERLDAFSARADAFSARFDEEFERFRRLLREMPAQRGARLLHIPRTLLAQFDDELKFLRSWTENPLIVGAISPSSRALGRMMARFVETERPGVIIELGPGTGAVTAALIDYGIAPERIVAVEYDADFCALLETRFPGVKVIQGDAYDLAATLGPQHGSAPVAAIVSSLPLLSRPMSERLSLLDQALDLVPEGVPFIQFSYALTPPIPEHAGRWSLTGSRRVWRNLPPARVWCYRRGLP